MANIKLILLDDVENLGLAGDEVSVAPGYARNYLLPRKLATKATSAVLKVIEARKAEIAVRRAKAVEAANALAAKIAELEISLAMQAAADDQLYGSVTPRMIADQLQAQGITVDHAHIRVEHPIKALGSYTVEVKLGSQVSAQLKVWVVRG